MKTTKRFIAMAAALTLTACTAIPMAMMTANAEATANTISFTNTVDTGHTYTGYQIFTGEIEDGVLKNVAWANTAKGADFLTALQGATATLSDDTTLGSKFTSATDAKTVAAAMSTITNSDDKDILAAFLATQTANMVKVNATAAESIDITATGDGYYLVIDEGSSAKPSAKTKYLLDSVDASKGAEIAVKSAVPSMVKKVQENTDVDDYDGMGETGNDWNDVADYNIGDAVPFKLYGSLPSNYGDYEHYYYKFTDTLAAGLTAPAAGDIKVKVNGTEVNDTAKNMRIVVSGQTITVSFEDIKVFADEATDIITVEYSATLNANAEVGLPGNENIAKLEFSNNPNLEYNPTTTDENEDKPKDDNGTPGDTTDDKDETGETPEDKVIVFTYQLDITKEDGATNAKLKDAKFKLINKDGKYATVDTNNKITGWVDDVADGSEFTSSAAGTFSIIGLDDGTYTLKETEAPATYNAPTPDTLEFTIDATTANNQTWDGTANKALTALNLTAATGAQLANDIGTGKAGTLDSGIVAATVYNTKGTTLPTTGGIGTTLFILGGGCAAGIAGIYLVSKKKTREEE